MRYNSFQSICGQSQMAESTTITGRSHMVPNLERRHKARFYHQSLITHEDLSSGILSSSRMYNFSKGGIYFESDLRLTPGEEIFIGIENSPYKPHTEMYECYHAIIRWRRKLDHSIYPYGYGVKFMNSEKPPNGHPEFVRIEIGESNSEQRKHKRHKYPKKIDYFANNQRFVGTIKDIGRSGAFIQTAQRFPNGQKLTLALPFVNRAKGSMVKGEVMWSNREGIGVKFKKRRTAVS